MTKINQEIYNTIETSELKFNKKQLEFLFIKLEEAGKRAPKAEENPDVLNDDGTIKEKWCGKHLRYEPIEDFTPKSNGKYDANCDVAITKWRELTKTIRYLEKQIPEVLANKTEKELHEHIELIEEAKADRLGTEAYSLS